MRRLIAALAPLALAAPLLVATPPASADDFNVPNDGEWHAVPSGAITYEADPSLDMKPLRHARTHCNRHRESDRDRWPSFSTEVKATIHYKVCRQQRQGRDRRWVTIRSTDHYIIHTNGEHNICATIDYVAWRLFRATSDIDHVHLPAGLKHDCREDQTGDDGKNRLHIDWALWMTDRHRRVFFRRDQPEWAAKVVPHLDIEIPHHSDRLSQRKLRGYFRPVGVAP